MSERPETVEALIARMDALLAPMVERRDPLRFFLGGYRRTTIGLRDVLGTGVFLDDEWVERWDVEFANLYLDAVDTFEAHKQPPGPWAAAFDITGQGGRLPPLRHLLLGMNAHINFDLPQSLIAVISDEEFEDDAVVAKRASDHSRVDEMLVERVKQVDQELKKVEDPGDRTLVDHLMRPFNQAGTRRFLKEARGKVWRNTKLLSLARRQGPDALAARLAELDRLCEERITDLRVPGQVLIKLSVKGFGVRLREGAPA